MDSIWLKKIIVLLTFITLIQDTKAQTNLYGDSISVNFFLLDDCKICDYYGPQLEAVKIKYPSFSYIGYFPNFSTKRPQIEAYKSQYGISFELKTDYYKTKSKMFDAEVLPTVVVYDEINERILYKGKIDDRFFSVTKQRRHIKEEYLLQALSAITQNRPIKQSLTQAVGCFINFMDNISK